MLKFDCRHHSSYLPMRKVKERNTTFLASGTMNKELISIEICKMQFTFSFEIKIKGVLYKSIYIYIPYLKI
jgi:hypothetical protein